MKFRQSVFLCRPDICAHHAGSRSNRKLLISIRSISGMKLLKMAVRLRLRSRVKPCTAPDQQLQLPFGPEQIQINPVWQNLSGNHRKRSRRFLAYPKQENLFSYEEIIKMDIENTLINLCIILNKNCNLNFVICYVLYIFDFILYYENFTKQEFENVVYFAPRNTHSFLDHHFPSFVARNDKLWDFSCRLAESGITRVGDVVKLTRDEALSFANGDPQLIALLITELSKVNLKLNMRTPGWKSPGGLFGPNW